jgi:hypothetical protein
MVLKGDGYGVMVPVEHEGGDQVQAELAELHVLLQTNAEYEHFDVALLLHYCYFILTLLLHNCYTVVTLLLHMLVLYGVLTKVEGVTLCNSGITVTMVLQWCYDGV